MTIENGATIWARQTIESQIFNKPDKWFKIWFYMVSRVNHTSNKQFCRGQGFFNYETIMLKCQATKAQVDHSIRWMKREGMLATTKATRGMIVTICNYDVYQRLANYKSDTIGDTKATQKRYKSDTINKNDKNVKNDKNKDLFDIFWKSYPKKVNKAYAKRVFVKLNPSRQLFEKMLSAIEEQKNSIDWKKENGQFIPHPSTWLNGERWADELFHKETTQEQFARLKAKGEI